MTTIHQAIRAVRSAEKLLALLSDAEPCPDKRYCLVPQRYGLISPELAEHARTLLHHFPTQAELEQWEKKLGG